jgi:uroporphyrinogen decarboxylase
MQVVLEAQPDLFLRRSWYEGSDFWSPQPYRRFVLPRLKEEVALAHQGGARFGYIQTSGTMARLDDLLAAGVDVLVGLDPGTLPPHGLQVVKERIGGQIALWGGVTAAPTVEEGSREQVRAAVRRAIECLAPGGGYILSPVDNITDLSEAAWNNVLTFISAWVEWREWP